MYGQHKREKSERFGEIAAKSANFQVLQKLDLLEHIQPFFSKRSLLKYKLRLRITYLKNEMDENGILIEIFGNICETLKITAFADCSSNMTSEWVILSP